MWTVQTVHLLEWKRSLDGYKRLALVSFISAVLIISVICMGSFPLAGESNSSGGSSSFDIYAYRMVQIGLVLGPTFDFVSPTEIYPVSSDDYYAGIHHLGAVYVIKVALTSVEMNNFILLKLFDGKEFKQTGIYGYGTNVILYARVIDGYTSIIEGAYPAATHFDADTSGILSSYPMGDVFMYYAHMVAVYQSMSSLKITNRLPPYNFMPIFVPPYTLTSPHVAWWKECEDVADYSPPASGPQVSGTTEFSSSEYRQIRTLNGLNAITDNAPDKTKKPLHNFRFKIAEDPSVIKNMTVSWAGYVTIGGKGVQLFIWKKFAEGGGEWEKVGEHSTINRVQSISKTYTSDFSDYIDENGYLYLAAIAMSYTSDRLTSVRSDYVEVVIIPTFAGFTLTVT